MLFRSQQLNPYPIHWKPRVTAVFVQLSVYQQKPVKRRRQAKEKDTPELLHTEHTKARRHSTIATSSKDVHSIPSITVTPHGTAMSGLTMTGAQPKMRVRKLSLSGSSSTLPTRSLLTGVNIPPRISVSSVRIGTKMEYSMAGMSIVFGSDRITLNINGNSTRILHSKLQLLEYYTASATKLLQIAIKGELADTSILSQFVNSSDPLEEPTKITLYTNERESVILDNCSKLRANGVEIDALSLSLPIVQEEHNETLFVFPFKPSGRTKSIAIHTEDAQRFSEGQFLNDTLIEFGLKYIHSNLESKNRVLASQVFVYNSFFFQRLLAKPIKGPLNSFDSVKNWTSKVDIFAMKYLIIPIHEKLHWHLAIIANPGLLLKDIEDSSSNSDTAVMMEPESLTGSLTDVEEMEIDSDMKKVQEHINAENRPYMICLDSLGRPHPTVFKVLRAYLEQELRDKKNITKTLTARTIPGKNTSNSPLQQNLCDCGVFLLHYVDVFLRNPTQMLDAIVNETDDSTLWAANELETKRERYKDIVDSLTEKYKVFQFSQETINHLKEKRKSFDDSMAGEGKIDPEEETHQGKTSPDNSNGLDSASGTDSASLSSSDLVSNLAILPKP
ncbi:hypothetical protein BGZ94_009353 [Podila epigama]|nr:hypothetical protein BGZ94_009353 [Podila epigama]